MNNMQSIFELNILNLTGSIMNLFENDIEALKSNSYELKKRIRENKMKAQISGVQQEVTYFTYFELLSEYFYKINTSLDIDKFKLGVDEINSFEHILKESGINSAGFNYEYLPKYFMVKIFSEVCNSHFNAKHLEITSPVASDLIQKMLGAIKNTPAIPYRKGNKLYFNFLFY
jgi:hypothetical protein